MTNHNFKLCNVDTDSILFCKQDQSPFSEEEQQQLLNEINGLMDQGIRFEHDGYFDKVIIFKAKNYILRGKGKTKQKGSSIKAPCLELRLKVFIDSTIELMLSEEKDYKDLILLNYNNIANEIIQPTIDINQWSFRKSLTEKSLDPETLNTIAKKIQYALEEDMDEIYELGDRVFLYFNTEEKLVLSKHYKNDHNQLRLLKKLFMTSQRFKDLLGKEFFPKYHLKTMYAKLLAQSQVSETQSGENIVDSF